MLLLLLRKAFANANILTVQLQFRPFFSLLYFSQRGQVSILPLLLVTRIHLIESRCGNLRNPNRKNSKDRPGLGPNRVLKSSLLVFWKVGDKPMYNKVQGANLPILWLQSDFYHLKPLFCLQTRRIASRATGIVHKKTSTVLCSLRFHGSSQWPEGEGNKAGMLKRTCRLYSIGPWCPYRGSLSKNHRNGKWICPCMWTLLDKWCIICSASTQGVVCGLYKAQMRAKSLPEQPW